MKDKYTITFKNKSVIVLNKDLVSSQNIDDEGLEVIRGLHVQRLALEENMELTECPVVLVSLDKIYTEIEFKLQDAWGFDRSIKFHRFWNRPKCGCPTMDNSDRYPTGHYIISGSCPLHGS